MTDNSAHTDLVAEAEAWAGDGVTATLILELADNLRHEESEKERLRAALADLADNYWEQQGMSRYWDVTVWLKERTAAILEVRA